ncbi:MAG: FAD binding domain-containing protein [Gammaproteobacteria bacterium]
MHPARIEQYVRPRTVSEALAALGRYEEGEAMFLAGGQSMMQAMKSRILRPECVIDLQDVTELRGISRDANGVRIGAMTRYVEVAAAPELDGMFAALADAAAHVGDRQVRNRGTVGGSVCWNYVAACTPCVVLGLGGTLELMAADGTTRSVAADEFFLGPLDTARREDEILLALSWPAAPPRAGSAYAKWGLVTDALPVVGVCVCVTLDDDDRCASARITLAGLANGAERAPVGEASLTGSAGDAAAIGAAMDAIADAAETQDDLSADADYRRQLIRSLGREVGARAFARARA